MRLLVIGGTAFIGRHAVEQAVAAGHDVTVFHRGRTNAELLADRIDHRYGDRTTGDYASLDTGEHWDAVIDVSAYYPGAVDDLATLLAGRVAHCVHISSISAYDNARITRHEDSPLNPVLSDPRRVKFSDETYGPLKAMCERAAVAGFGADRTTIVRPTYVVGPLDHTDRFTYWVRRVAEGGDIAVVHPDRPVQVIDARDLGAFIVRCATAQIAGAFDGVGPALPTLSAMLDSFAVPGVAYRLVDVGAAALAASGLDLPMLDPDPGPAEFMDRPGTAARAAGLRIRPLAETVEALRGWDRARGFPALAAGPSREQEVDLLASAG